MANWPKQYGTPRAVLCDGAVELRDGAECLQKQRPDTIVLQDFKHKAAIFLKAAVGDHPRFAEFNTHLGKTRSAIQQTELAHLTPPGQKPKARFMNLASTLDWAATVLWLLDHPEAKARDSLTPERLEEKLGWLRSFATELAEWRECQQVVNAGVTFINEQGLFRGAGEQLRRGDGHESDARGQPAIGPTTRRFRHRGGRPTEGRRTLADEHRDPRIDVRALQAIGAPAFQGRLHQLAGRLWRPAQTGDRRNHPTGLLHRVGQGRPPMDPREPGSHLNLQTPRHVQGIPKRNKTGQQQLRRFIRPGPG